MINRRRGILIGVLLAFLATASLAVAVAAYIQRLPDPDTADRRGLFRWLVECDLAEQSPELQLVVMRRVERELLARIDFRDVMTILDSDQRRRFLLNADLLARCWFGQAADHYFAALENEREAVLRQQLDEIHRLGIMEQLAALESAKDEGPSAKPIAGCSLGGLAEQMARLNRWVAEATPQERYRLAQYFAAFGNRLLADSFQKLGGLRKWLPSW